MDKLLELEKIVNGLGFFAGTFKISIDLERSFEGCSGRASETWENKITIKSNSISFSGGNTIPEISVNGCRKRINEVVDEYIKVLEKYIKN